MSLEKQLATENTEKDKWVIKCSRLAQQVDKLEQLQITCALSVFSVARIEVLA